MEGRRNIGPRSWVSVREDSGESDSVTFAEALEQELVLIAGAREKRGFAPRERHLESDLIGLAFSGGGIRSATFNLGVIQALAKNHLLRSLDYLSTVSGGGYIGSWLTSWGYYVGKEHPNSQNQIDIIEQQLNIQPQSPGDVAEPHQVHFLRKYSNYLTPQLGALSGDTLAFTGTYIRNLILNQFILISALLAILVAPRAIGLLFAILQCPATLAITLYLAIFLLLAGFVRILSNMHSARVDSTPSVWFWIVVPLFLFCILLAYLFWQLAEKHYLEYLTSSASWVNQVSVVVWSALLYASIWAFATLAMLANQTYSAQKAEAADVVQVSAYFRWAPAVWAVPAGAAGGAFLLLMARIFDSWSRTAVQQSVHYLVTFGIPLAVLFVLLIGIVHLGLIGRAYEDGLREWWARLGGAVLALAIYWFLLSLLALFVPVGFDRIETFLLNSDRRWVTQVWKALTALGVVGAIGGWISATFKGLFAAKSAQTGPKSQVSDNGSGSSSRAADFAARLAPPVFAVGLLICLSIILHLTLPRRIDGVSATNFWFIAFLGAGLYGISRFVGYRVDVNEFSLHNAYRNRIVRCYLGATHNGRHPHPFTGFDDSDNICLAWLRDLGIPFHILNATLNVVKGKELALQARKARSFTFTPLYSGFDYSEDSSVSNLPGAKDSAQRTQRTSDPEVEKLGSYRLTEHFAWRSRYPGGRLGTAMAISGAAASPNMGHYTTGAVSFLLTIFSVRLGWWIGNPRRKKYWESGHPRSSWAALFNELTGNTTEDGKVVYMSDGGHFENLGIYELIRRRCRLVIACDAGADPSCRCNDLASAIEKCRVDFGTEIDISLDDVRPSQPIFPGDQNLRMSKSPFVSGNIRYPDGRKGILIYIKPSLNAQLPQDALAYARLAATFPHQSTVDQFFDEAQFESYRILGFYCASAAISEIRKAIDS